MHPATNHPSVVMLVGTPVAKSLNKKGSTTVQAIEPLRWNWLLYDYFAPALRRAQPRANTPNPPRARVAGSGTGAVTVKLAFQSRME